MARDTGSFRFLFVRWKHTGVPQTDVPQPLSAQYRPDSTFALPVGPTAIDYAIDAPTRLTFTHGGTTIQRSPLRRWRVTLQGEVGLQYRLGFDKDGIPMLAPWTEIHDAWVEWIQAFWDDGGKGDNLRMSFHDFLTGRQLWVEPMMFSDGRDEQHTLAPKYSVNLIAYDRASYPNAGLGFALSLLARTQEQLRNVDRWLNLVSAGIAVAELAAEQATQILKETGDLFSFIPRLTSAVAGITDDAADLARFPADFWRDTLEDMRAAGAKMSEAIDNVVSGAARTDALFDAKADIRELERQVRTAFLAMSSGAIDDGSSGGAQYEVKPGDTLKKIATAVLGDGSLWTLIADLNNLVPPYITPSGIPGTAAAGDKLILPAGSVLPAALTSGRSEADQGATDAALYGTDLALGDDGDLQAEPGDFPADVQLVSGIPCVVQGLSKVLFKTTTGESRAFPNMGLLSAVGDPSYKNGGLTLAQLVDQVLQDDRFVAVRDEAVEFSSGTLTLSLKPVLRSGRRLSVTAAVATT